MTTTVRHYNSEMGGLQKLTSSNGSLIDVLKACLVDGFSDTSIDSMTFALGLVTAVVSAGHPFSVDQVIDVTGAGETEYNGTWIVESITASDVVFAITGTPVPAATGSISIKASPAGWVKEYEDLGANKIVLKSPEVTGSGCLIRVIEDGTSGVDVAKVQIYESMTDIDSGVMIREGYISKRYSTGVDLGMFVLCANRGIMHLFTGNNTPLAGSDHHVYSHTILGDSKSYLDGDTGHCTMQISNLSGAYLRANIRTGGLTVSKALNHIEVNETYEVVTSRSNPNTSVTTSEELYNVVDGRVFFDPLYLYHTTEKHIRAKLQGLFLASTRRGLGFTNKEIVVIEGVKMLIVKTGSGNSSVNQTGVNTIMLGVEIGKDW